LPAAKDDFNVVEEDVDGAGKTVKKLAPGLIGALATPPTVMTIVAATDVAPVGSGTAGTVTVIRVPLQLVTVAAVLVGVVPAVLKVTVLLFCNPPK